jgi:aminomethyltransferase
LRGIVAEGRQPLRDAAVVRCGATAVGTVTSGNFSPVLERGIAMAFVDTGARIDDGTQVELELRGRAVPARLTALPFVRQGATASRLGAA